MNNPLVFILYLMLCIWPIHLLGTIICLEKLIQGVLILMIRVLPIQLDFIATSMVVFPILRTIFHLYLRNYNLFFPYFCTYVWCVF